MGLQQVKTYINSREEVIGARRRQTLLRDMYNGFVVVVVNEKFLVIELTVIPFFVPLRLE